MPSSGSRTLAIGAAAIALIAAVVVMRREPAKPGSNAGGGAASASTPASAAETSSVGATAEPARARDAAAAPPKGHVLRTLAWGRGEGSIGLPSEEEGEGETPLQLTTDASGNVLLLDGENDRVVRVGLDGKPLGDVALPIKDPRDVAAAKDGSLLLLEARGERSGVTIVGPDGKLRGKISVPEDVAKTSRSVFVSGDDVYVESYRGELTRVAGIDGTADPSPKTAPGQPTRDGTGYVNARLIEDGSGAIHVWVLERESRAQRFSRHVRPHVLTEGIFLVDTDVAGTIYVGVTGVAPGAPGGDFAAQLLCLDPASGAIVGSVDLPVNVGPEVILDARALDAGGVVYSVFTKAGMRVERHDCR